MSKPTLGNPQNTIEILQKYHFNFQKKFGQNFLIDTHVLEKIISAAGITKEDIPALMETGVDGIALSGTILRAGSPTEETRNILKILT